MTGGLTLTEVTARRGATVVLGGISLDVPQGQFVSILGPSGAGKSTLFEILLGSLAATSGRVDFDGRPLDRTASPFAYMPQRDALMPWRRIIDNVGLGLEVAGMSRQQARAAVRPLFPRFGLEGFERHWPHQLSGGMRQRAALARTIVQDRPMMLLDEPFGALDALTRGDMQRWLERRWIDARWTTLLITHDVREAVALSDRVHVLSPRPARVVETFEIDLPRPRLTSGPTEGAAALERAILAKLKEGTHRCPD